MSQQNLNSIYLFYFESQSLDENYPFHFEKIERIQILDKAGKNDPPISPLFNSTKISN